MKKREYQDLIERQNELWYKAVSRYLKTDWEASDWLDREDRKEYLEIRELISRFYT